MTPDEARVCRAALDAIEVDLAAARGWLDSIASAERRLRGPHTMEAYHLLDSLADATVVDPLGMIREARLDVSWQEAHPNG